MYLKTQFRFSIISILQNYLKNKNYIKLMFTYLDTVAIKKSIGTVAGKESNLMPRFLNSQLARPLLACSI